VLKFFVVLTLAAFALWGILEVMINYDWLKARPSYSFEILALLYSATLIIYYYLGRVSENTFVQLYLLTMAIKILAFASFALLMVMNDKPGVVSNVAFFLLAYLVFTVLEIGFLYRRFNPPGGLR
jgi:hypothetical protein